MTRGEEIALVLVLAVLTLVFELLVVRVTHTEISELCGAVVNVWFCK